MITDSRILLLCIVLAAAGCAASGGLDAAGRVDEAAGRRAALANLTVENRTGRLLRISFRPAGAPGREVEVGRVPASQSRAMAPIPAGEPIVLVARRDDGAELTLPPRSFGLGAAWHWVIPPDTHFALPRSDAP